LALLAVTVAPVRENKRSEETLVDTALKHLRASQAKTGKV